MIPVAAALLFLLVTHWAPSCQWEANLAHHEGQLVLVDEYVSACESLMFDAMVDEFGIVVIGTPQYLIMFALPPGTQTGWVHYNFMSSYATVNGTKCVVLIELREEI